MKKFWMNYPLTLNNALFRSFIMLCAFISTGCDQNNADQAPTGSLGDISSNFVDENKIPPLPQAEARPLFNPAASQVPLANDLIFSGTTD